MTPERLAIKKYNSHRSFIAKHALCHAPFSSINFTQNGDMRVCCYNKTEILGIYPQHSIKEAWGSALASTLRATMRSKELAGGCEGCMEQIMAGNYQGTKAMYYEEYASIKSLLPLPPSPPKVFEFEISNTCNLECIMCNGYFSSAIRANRENLPKLNSPYDGAFIAEVKTFLPYLTDAKFLGGEPFLISQYYEIWDAIIAVNPHIKVHITTNGTVLNKRAKELLERINAGIVISIDSLNKENYEKIRTNADFDVVQENIRWFIEYRNRKGLYLTFAICPIRSNSKYLADIVKFCNKNDIHVHFNTVWDPVEESLQHAPYKLIQNLIQDLNEIEFGNTVTHEINKGRTEDLLSQLNEWIINIKQEDTSRNDIIEAIENNAHNLILSNKASELLTQIISHYNRQEDIIATEDYLGTRLEIKCQDIGQDIFRAIFWECVLYSSENAFSSQMHKNVKNNVDQLQLFTQHMNAELLNKTMLQRNFDFITILTYLRDMPFEQIKQLQIQTLNT